MTNAERLAMIEQKLDTLHSDFKDSLILQRKIDEDQNKRLSELERTFYKTPQLCADKFASKDEVKEIKALILGLYLTIIGAIATAFITKAMGLW